MRQTILEPSPQLGLSLRYWRNCASALACALSALAGYGCKSECKGENTEASVDGPIEAAAGTLSLVSGTANVVEPGVNNRHGELSLLWQSPGLGTTLRVPDLKFGAEGSVDARAAGAVLCWCPDGARTCPHPVQNDGQPGVRCLELSGTIDIARYALVHTDLGSERDVDLLLDVSGAAGDASAALQLHIVIRDDLFTFECPHVQDPISWLLQTRDVTGGQLACRGVNFAAQSLDPG
jgi:hypothetical protein